MRGGAPSTYSGPLPLSASGGPWELPAAPPRAAAGRGEPGTARRGRGAAGTGPRAVRCGGGAKAVPEMSYRLPVCANAVGRQLTLFKGDFFPVFSLYPAQTFSGGGAVGVFVRSFWRSSFDWPF